MKICIVILIFILYLKTYCVCAAHKRKTTDPNISSYKSNNGEPIALAHLILEYESDHMKLFKNQVNKDDNLEWNDLENKDLDEYCRRYLQQCVPGRTTLIATGSKYIRLLRYTTSGYHFLKNNIVVVTCVTMIKHKIWYHLTRALEPNCVYALNRDKGGLRHSSVFTIINKHCDFQLHDYDRNKGPKRRGIKKIHYGQLVDDDAFKKQCKEKSGHLNHKSGEIIADDESIKVYELEHQKLYKREATESNSIQWPFVMQHRNLNEYCIKYLKACVPSRNIEGVVGSWSWKNLQWRGNEEKIIEVVAAECYIPYRNNSYYFTKALDKNCVYALLRYGRCLKDPFVIIFQHCSFDLPNIKLEGPEKSGDGRLNTTA